MESTINQNLTTILQEKLNNRIEIGLQKSKPYLDKIEVEGSMLSDYIMKLGKDGQVEFDNDGSSVKMVMKNGTDKMFNLHPHAIGQLGDKLGIPNSYIRGLAEKKNRMVGRAC